MFSVRTDFWSSDWLRCIVLQWRYFHRAACSCSNWQCCEVKDFQCRYLMILHYGYHGDMFAWGLDIVQNFWMTVLHCVTMVVMCIWCFQLEMISSIPIDSTAFCYHGDMYLRSPDSQIPTDNGNLCYHGDTYWRSAVRAGFTMLPVTFILCYTFIVVTLLWIFIIMFQEAYRHIRHRLYFYIWFFRIF